MSNETTNDMVVKMSLTKKVDGGIVSGPHGAAKLLGLKRTTLLDSMKNGISKTQQL